MIPASLLAALLAFSPPTDNATDNTTEPPAPTLQESTNADYQAALQRIRAAQQIANQNPARGARGLRDALNVLLQNFRRELATDPEGQSLRTMAQLTLARALLASNDAEGARKVMDEAIRTSRGDPLPTKSFGPGLVALHRERDGVLAKTGAGSLEIKCHTPCRVFINERPTQERTGGLVPGSYRLLIEASDGSEDPVHKFVEIDHDQQVVKLEFGKVETKVIPEGTGEEPRGARERLLPRWADVLLMSVGAAVIGTGAALWAIDGSCPKGADPNDTAACPQVYTTKVAGIATVATGSALFLSGTVLLTVDEIRVGRQRGTQASLVWTFRF